MKNKPQNASGGLIRWRRGLILGAVAALVIGIYAWGANSGMMEVLGGKAENTYYNLLVQGFRAGQLNLKTEVPAGLAQLPDPYDPAANAPYRWIDGHPVHDLSYYQGKMYLYFGVTPALVVFWPLQILTGHYLMHRTAVVFFFSVGFLISTWLLRAIWRRYFADVDFWVIAACTVALGLANFVPAILTRCDVYEVAISCGYALTVAALAGVWGALTDSQGRWRWLAAASLAYGLAVGARPSLLPGAVILLAPVLQAWREKRRMWPLALAAAGPIGLVGVGLMFYNVARFGHALEFGQHYQLSVMRPDTVEQFSLRYLWFNVRVAFLAPARWIGRFPFVFDIVLPALPKGGAAAEHPFGLVPNIPLVWLALAAPLAWRGQSAEARSTLRWFVGAVAMLFGICALTISLHNSMCLRYEVEFAHVSVLLAVIGVLAVERALAGQTMWRWVARCGWGLLLIISVAFNLLATVGLQAENYLNLSHIYAQQGKMDEATAQYEKILKIGTLAAQGEVKLGVSFYQQGRLNEAVSHFQKALELNPNDADTRINLGFSLYRLGRLDEAMAQYRMALEISPANAIAHNNLGLALEQKGQWDEARVQIEKALELDPYLADAHGNLAIALLQKGEVKNALSHYQSALQIKPAEAMFQNNLAWLLVTCEDKSLRNGKTAVDMARQAVALTGEKNAGFLRTLAAAYAETGQFNDAVATAQKAMALARAAGDAGWAAQLNNELNQYQAGRTLVP